MDFNRFQQALKDNLRNQMNNSPERMAEARQSIEALSGFVEVVRENASNILDDAQKGLMFLSEQLSEAQAKATDETVKEETPDWNAFGDVFAKWAEEPAVNETAKPTGVPTTLEEKFEWLVDNVAEKIWPDKEALGIVKEKGDGYRKSMDFLVNYLPETIEANFARFYKP